MCLRKLLNATALLSVALAAPLGAQTPPAAAPATPAPARANPRATFPAQQRPPGDPALIAKGKAIYEISCRACHGPDLRGGDVGGPNLLRSDIVLKDDHGELLEPIIKNGKSTPGVTLVMPPLPLSSDDIRAVAEFIHDVVSTARGQGAPPPGPPVVLNIVVGDAAAGQAYFNAKCSSCHSATGDLRGLATRISEPKDLQNAWVNGLRTAATPSKPTTVTVTEASGQRVEGVLDRIDDFSVALTSADGRRRTFVRRGNVPRVEIHDPRAAHTDLLSVYTDKDIHNVTAYLTTLK